MELEETPFSPAEVVQDILKMALAATREKGITVQAEVDNNVPKKVSMSSVHFYPMITTWGVGWFISQNSNCIQAIALYSHWLWESNPLCISCVWQVIINPATSGFMWSHGASMYMWEDQLIKQEMVGLKYFDQLGCQRQASDSADYEIPCPQCHQIHS